MKLVGRLVEVCFYLPCKEPAFIVHFSGVSFSRGLEKLHLPKSLLKFFLFLALPVVCAVSGCSPVRRNIVLTGYWPPTNQMLAQFSTDKKLNPSGWKGRNWRHLGYDVYSFFPTFPKGLRENPQGQGDFRVDYQATQADFRGITRQLIPIAIISFGRGDGPWEVEYNAVNSVEWTDDFVEPVQMSKLPPEQIAPIGHKRHSSLPVEAIADAVNQAQIGVHAWVDWEGNPGTSLGNYIAYLVSWYQDFYSDASEMDRCLAAGFIHVSADLPLAKAIKATEITLETTINHIEAQKSGMTGP
jgi:hypothetical protein